MSSRVVLRRTAAALATAVLGLSGVGSAQAGATGALAPAADMPAACSQQKNIICVSKAEKTLRYFENGKEQLTAEVRFGRPGHETPTGTWKIETKDPSTWWSYPYKVYMPWGMKFDLTEGLYIHYSSGFALNNQTYIGSHGCVQFGDWEKMRTLYQKAPVGTTLIIY
ncbi:hypothetical protein KEM60_00502 [Austwickia sp. TVS 96-490-7B]|uniref:L,D-transpeptidase n=1 Tax=Austwickia sp. TVS 96-490-7B TaxID=2830843 RepID=UPI001C592DD3|nr:L,D-transpeptidase [Austwickia sp. TVS 96-490-7B]MBW3084315.1 hypothetical protein [Austwickia sp. TVS 96-490-7B]